MPGRRTRQGANALPGRHRPDHNVNRGSKIERPFDVARPPARADGAATAQRDAILRAAARVFRDRGFADTGMRDIADAADLSPANLYHYFRGKDELLFFCQDRALDRLLDALAAAREARASAADRLRDVARRARPLPARRGRRRRRRTSRSTRCRRALRARIVAKRDRYERGVRALVADGVRARRASRDSTPPIATRALLGALNWTVALVPARRRRDAEPSPTRSPTTSSRGSRRCRSARRDATSPAWHVRHIRLALHRQRRAGRGRSFAPYKTLLEVLREDLSLTGTKHGCELGECGACAVLRRRPAGALLPGARRRVRRPRRSTTVEGLATDGRLHPLQEAFADLGAAQCGYCTPGFLVTAKALLDEQAAPDARRDPRSARGQPLPLHRLPADLRGGRSGRERSRSRRNGADAMSERTRRHRHSRGAASTAAPRSPARRASPTT